MGPRGSEIFRPYGFDKPLFLVTLLLLFIGLVMVFSSSGVLSSERYNQPFHYLVHQIIGAVAGIVLLLGMLGVRRPFYRNTTFVHALLLLSVFLLALSLVMPAAGKTNRWIQVSGLRFQPSELAKIAVVIFLALFLERHGERINELKTLWRPVAVLFLVTLLILREPDYGTALLVCFLAAVMLFLGGLQFRFFLLLAPASLGFFAFTLFQASYRQNRILAFLHPEDDPLGRGFQVIQSIRAVGSGGPLGVNIGQSSQKLFFLPSAHTDYIYAIIGEELGLLGTMAVLLLFLFFLWRGLRIAWRAPDTFSQLAAAGLTLAVFFQAVLNISIVLGLAPPTGFPLPLISYGRSSLVCTLFSIGILLHISQRKRTTRA